MNTERVLRNTAATISVTFYNGTTAVEADTAVSVTAKKADGSTLFTTTATNDPAVGVYSVVIPPQSSLNQLTLVWSGTFTGTTITVETIVEIVGGFFFSISELRAYDSTLQNTTRFPTSSLVDARMQVEAEFEDICHRAFVPRYYRETGIVVDHDSSMLWLEKPEPIKFLSFKVNDVDQISWYNSGYLMRDKYSPRGIITKNLALASMYAYDVTAEYEYGLTQVPIPIKQKALKRAKMILLGQNSTIDERALTMTLPDIGTVNLATPGVRGAETGVPDIDVVLRRYTIDGGAGVY